MTSRQWTSKIKKAMKDNGVYKKSFDNTILILSEILAERDQVKEKYDGNPVVLHTNSHGATNPVKNQYLVLWNELNKSALSYIKELGLTPAGLKKIDTKDMNNGKDNLSRILDSINET